MVFTIRNLFMKPASAVLREREGAFIMATNMTNSEAMVTSAASYTTYGCPRHQNIFTKTTLSKGAFSDAEFHRIGAIIRRKYKKNRRKQVAYKQNCRSTFHGRFMRQNCYEAKICVRKTIIDSSIQAQTDGGFMCQKW